MIRPDLINVPGSPKAVREAFESWKLFVQANTTAIVAVTVPERALSEDFFKCLLIKGGTDRDIKWLIDNAGISFSDLAVWDSVIEEYASKSLEEDAE